MQNYEILSGLLNESQLDLLLNQLPKPLRRSVRSLGLSNTFPQLLIAQSTILRLNSLQQIRRHHVTRQLQLKAL